MKYKTNILSINLNRNVLAVGFWFLVGALLLIGTITVHATEPSETKKALEQAKGVVDELIVAKDGDGPAQDLASRIKTFKSVIDLSVSEVKDTRINLLSSDQLLVLESENERMSLWKEKSLNSLNGASEYFNQKKESLVQVESNLTVEEIQALALEFKVWREENYLPVREEINSLLLIIKEGQIISTAKSRWQKIENDLGSLEKARVIGELSPLWVMLEETKILIDTGEKNNKEAFYLFLELYVEEKVTTSSDSNALLEPEVNFLMEVEPMDSLNESMPGEQISSPVTTTDEQPDITEQLSIKDLVRSSLINIREAYGVFIEMSNFVRKLLI